MIAIKNLTQPKREPSTRVLRNQGIIMMDGGVYNEDHYFSLTQLLHQVQFHLEKNDQLICYLQITKIDKYDLKGINDLFSVMEKYHDQKEITVFWIVPQGSEFLYEFGVQFEMLYPFDIDVITL